MRLPLLTVASLLATQAVAPSASAQSPRQPNWADIERETLEHFQNILRIDTRNPPGRETRAAEYIKSVFDKEGIPAQVIALDSNRANVVARLTGNGRKRPILIMGHTDVVTVDTTKWTHPPFAATRDGGYVYGRGAVDDKDNVTAGLMTMLLLKRLKVPLDRDVIFLAESGEEGTTRVGIGYMVDQHFADIEAEYCLAEGGNVTRENGKIRYASVQTLEKIPRAIQLTGDDSAKLRQAIERISPTLQRLVVYRF